MMNKNISTKDEFIKYKGEFINSYLNEFNCIERYLAKINKTVNIRVIESVLIKLVFLYFLNIEGIEVDGKNNTLLKREKDYLESTFNDFDTNNKNFYEDYLKPIIFSNFFSTINELSDIKWNKVNLEIPNVIFCNDRKRTQQYDGEGLISILNKYRFTISDNINYNRITPEILGDIRLRFLDEKYRGSNGVVYSSKELVKCMCQNALSYYLEEKTDLSFNELYEFINKVNISNIDDTNTIRKIKSRSLILDELLENIRILDPASGCGAFEIGMLHEIIETKTKLKHLLKVKISSEDLYLLKVNAISKNIYAIDIDKFSNSINLLRIWLYTLEGYDKVESIITLNELNNNIIHGNSLMINLTLKNKYTSIEKHKTINLNCFDIAIGNPPFVSYQGNSKLFNNIKKSKFGLEYYNKNMNLYYYFFHKCIEIINEKGFIVFITPNDYFYNIAAAKLRNEIANKTTIRQLIKYNKLIKIFEGEKRGIKSETLITVLQKIPKTYICQINYRGQIDYPYLVSVFSRKSEAKGKKAATINQYILYKTSNPEKDNNLRLIFDEDYYEILNKISANKIELGTICNSSRGIKVNSEPDDIIVITPSQKKNVEGKLSDKEIQFIRHFGKGEFINNYYIDWKQRLFILCIDTDSDINQFPKLKKYYHDNHIIHKPYDINKFNNYCNIVNRKDYNKSNKFALDDEKRIWPSGVIITCVKKDYLQSMQSKINLTEQQVTKLILGILNSQLIWFWLLNNAKRDEDKIVLENHEVEKIPFVKIEEENQMIINAIIDNINEIKKIVDNISPEVAQNFVESRKKIIDNYVYELYKISEEEKRKIVGFLEEFDHD